MKEKSTAYSVKLRTQIGQIKTELQDAVDKNELMKTTESPLYELDVEVSGLSKLLDGMEASISQIKKNGHA